MKHKLNKDFFYRTLHVIVLMISLVGFSLTVKAQGEPKFTIKFKLTINDGNFDHALVTITKNGNPYRVIDPNGGKSNVDLDLNATYQFTCTKMGYITKSVIVDTHIPTGREKEDFAKFNALVELFKQPEDAEVTFSQPVGRITYSMEVGDFDFDKDYTAKAVEMQKKAEAAPIPKPKPPPPPPKVASAPKVAPPLPPSKPIPVVVKQPEYKSEPEKPKPVEVYKPEKPKPMPKTVEPEKPQKPIVKNKTEKIIQEDRRKLTIVTVNIDGKDYIYRKEEYNWGGVYYYRDGANITVLTYEHETE